MASTRRDWIFGTLGSAAWAHIAAAHEHARQITTGATPPKFDFFDAHSAASLDCITSQILPSDDGPGAREAGVVFFIDRALTTFDRDKQDEYRRGMADVHALSRKLFDGTGEITSLSSDQQQKLVRAFENTDFFETIRVHTLLGFLGSPDYGGNRGQVGWKYIGFEDRESWQPPFGYYDAQIK